MGNVLFESQTPALVISNMVLLTIIYYSLQPAYYNLQTNPPKRLYLGIVCIFLFTMFSFWIHDWFGYQREYMLIRESEWYRERTSLEPVYIWIILHSPDYLIFRFVVVGGALLLVYLIIRHLQVSRDLSCFFFGVLFLPLFAYARVSLAVVMMLYGTVLISRPFANRRTLSYVSGVVLVVVSVFFHKSAAMGILVVIFSFISRTANKNSWFYIVLAFIATAVIARVAISIFLGGALDSDEMSSKSMEAGQKYMNKEAVESGVGALLGYTLERTPYYLCALLSFQIQSEYKVPKEIEAILKFDMYLVLLATVFAVDLGANTSIMFGRLLRFALVPSTVIMAYAYQYGLFTKLVKIIFFIGLSCVIYRLTYTFYNVLVA